MNKKLIIMILFIFLISMISFSFTDKQYQVILTYNSCIGNKYTVTGEILQRINGVNGYSMETGYVEKYDEYVSNLIFIFPQTFDTTCILKELFEHDDIVEWKDIVLTEIVKKENIWGSYIFIPYFLFTDESTCILIK
jgi:hypothetical protein